MTLKKKPRGKPFAKGNKLSKGRPPVPDDVREARRIDREFVHDVLSRFLYKTVEELEAMVSDPQISVFESMVAKAAIVAIETGDTFRLDFFLNRLIGKVTDKVEHSLPKPTIIEYPDGGKMVLGYEKE